MYSEKVIDYFRNPEYAGVIEDANGIGEEGNVKCGDLMKIFLKVKDNVIEDIKFQTYGCMAAIASSNALCKVVKGKTIEQAEKVTFKDVLNELGEMPKIKVHCSVLGIEALRNAIKDYKKRNESNKESNKGKNE